MEYIERRTSTNFRPFYLKCNFWYKIVFVINFTLFLSLNTPYSSEISWNLDCAVSWLFGFLFGCYFISSCGCPFFNALISAHQELHKNLFPFHRLHLNSYFLLKTSSMQPNFAQRDKRPFSFISTF